MTQINLDKISLVKRIREQFENIELLKYQRALQEFFDGDKFIGDNVFETSFKLHSGEAPIIYEVSGPYCAISNEYATIGRIYENGQQVFESDIKQQIQQRTAAMAWLFLSSIGHKPNNILFVGAGKLALETVEYLKHFAPELSSIDYHARNRHVRTFEEPCNTLGVATRYLDKINLAGYDTIIMATNTQFCLVENSNIDSIDAGTVIVSMCTTSQTGEIAGDIYSRGDVNVMFDYELTRSFTPDMNAANKAGHLKNVTFFDQILKGKLLSDISKKKNVIRITGTPMQNVVVLDMLRRLKAM